MASVLQVKRQCLADTAVEQRLDNIEAKLSADLGATDNVKPFRNVA